MIDREKDRLSRMLEMQRRLQIEAYGHPAEPTPAQLMNSIRENVLSCVAELCEAMDETGWKPWSTSEHINREAFHREMVDAWHFFMNLMNAGGMTAEDLYCGYLEKSAINLKRQLDGYDGISSKCPGCKRDYNEPGVRCFAPTVEAMGYCTTNTEIFG